MTDRYKAWNHVVDESCAKHAAAIRRAEVSYDAAIEAADKAYLAATRARERDMPRVSNRLAAASLTARGLARQVGCAEVTIRKWLAGQFRNLELDVWLARRTEMLAADPPPVWAHRARDSGTVEGTGGND